MTPRTMLSQRAVPTALALVCTVIVRFVPTGDPARPIAGLLLAGPLLAWSIDRRVVASMNKLPTTEVRWALAWGFALGADLAVGFVLVVTPIDLAATPMAVGLLLVVGACDLGVRPLSLKTGFGPAVRLTTWGFAWLGVGLAVAAFLIARNGAVSYSHKQATASAYLVRDATRNTIILHNATSHMQQFSVVISGVGSRSDHRIVTLAAGAERRLPVSIGSSRQAAKPFAVKAIVTSGPQRGRTLRLTAPAGA